MNSASNTRRPLLNYTFAVNQLGKNHDLLIKMLHKFSDEFNDVPKQVAELVKQKDFKGAKMAAHTVKGISGNLGLEAIYDLSTKIDADLRNEIADKNDLEEFIRLMSATCDVIASGNFDNSSETASIVEEEVEHSTESAEQSKIQLLNALEQNDFVDDETLASLLQQMKATPLVTQEITRLIDELQYPAAITLVKTI